MRLAALMAIPALVALGQAPNVLSFEVASIKPSEAAAGNSGITTSKGRISAENVTLKRCIRGAYGIPEDRVVGGPKWTGENRYNIEARAAGPAGDAELMAMLQALMADRFKLTFHRETKQLAGYALVVGRGGLKMKASDPGAEGKTNTSRGVMEATACAMGQLALHLSLALRAPVADLTDTKGVFDFRLEWAPDEMQAKTNAEAPAGLSLFSAVQEQLGLKLEPRKIAAEVVVIDHAEEPSEN